jgi:peptidoglycan/LPS O-acetylase OafA/YrhL
MQKKILFLDGLRGIAAFYILVSHARWLLWEGYRTGYLIHPQNYSVVSKTLMYFFSLFKWSHEVVIFFFVLSGFVIHLKYARSLHQNPKSSINFAEYFIKRIKRIYPPLLFALAITMLLDMAGKANAFPIYFGNTPYPLINANIANGSHQLSVFIGNVFFLYTEYVPIYGSNGPLWSLKFEWWFYMLYPLFLLLSRKQIYYSTLLIILLFIGVFFPAIWPLQLLRSVFSMMIYWWLGVLLAEISAGRLKVNLIIFSTASFIGFVVLSFCNAIMHDLQTALLFSAVIGFLLWWNEKGLSLRFLELLKPLGDFSYTLYIIHFPILVFLSGMIMKFNHNQLPVHSFFILGGIIICLAISYLFHFFTETPFLTKKNYFLPRNDFLK